MGTMESHEVGPRTLRSLTTRDPLNRLAGCRLRNRINPTCLVEYIQHFTPNQLPRTSSRKCRLARNFRVRLAVTIASTPVFGFRPSRSALSLRTNAPNLATFTLSPRAKASLIRARIWSTNRCDFARGTPSLRWSASLSSAFVRILVPTFTSRLNRYHQTYLPIERV